LNDARLQRGRLAKPPSPRPGFLGNIAGLLSAISAIFAVVIEFHAPQAQE
jgi:hypothetical protein